MQELTLGHKRYSLRDSPLQANFGENVLFAYVKRGDLNASHKRKEIETDPIGEYYLEVGEAPSVQYGYTENSPP